MSTPRHRPPVIIRQRIAIIRMHAVCDDDRRALARRQPTQIGKPDFGDENIDIIESVDLLRADGARELAGLRRLHDTFRRGKAEIGEENIKGYILDLRGNPGGLLSQAISTSNLFLDHGKIVSTIGRNPDSHQFFEATEGDIADGKPIAVLQFRLGR